MIKKIFQLMLLFTMVLFISCKDDDSTIEVSSVSIDPATLSLQVGKTAKLNAIVTPENADTELQWSTSSDAIASVDQTGVVTAVAEGDATITVTAAKGGKTAICKIAVEDPNYIEINGVKVAVGNLVADGTNGAKIGTSTDIGLYFQFGSLIGWNNSGNAPTIAIKPVAFNGNADWNDIGKIWQGTTGVVSFTTTGSDEEKAGIGDPCRYYLKGTWRLPTKEEFATIFSNTTTGWKGATNWSWTDPSATHTTGLVFLAPGGWQASISDLIMSGIGSYWSSSPDTSLGYNLRFYKTTITPNDSSNRRFGYPVRCIKD